MADARNGVAVEPWVAELAPAFLANRRKDAQLLRAAFLERNYDLIRRIGHNVRGIAGGYGFPRIAEAAELLEAAAKSGDDQAIQRAIDAFVETIPPA